MWCSAVPGLKLHRLHISGSSAQLYFAHSLCTFVAWNASATALTCCATISGGQSCWPSCTPGQPNAIKPQLIKMFQNIYFYTLHASWLYQPSLA